MTKPSESNLAAREHRRDLNAELREALEQTRHGEWARKTEFLPQPGGAILGESAAMLLLLGECHPESGLLPAPGSVESPACLHWLPFMATTGYMSRYRTGRDKATATSAEASGMRFSKVAADGFDFA